MDDTELKEYTHLMLSNVAAALGEAFSVYLKLAIERAVQSLSTDSTGGTGTSDKDDDKSVSLNSMEESDAEEAENSHDTRLNTHTGDPSEFWCLGTESWFCQLAFWIQDTNEVGE